MKLVLTVLYILYIITTLLQIAMILVSDIRHNRVDGYTLGYNLGMLVLVIVSNYDFGVLISYFGISFGSLVLFAVMWLFTWALYAYYPIMRINPFWKQCW